MKIFVASIVTACLLTLSGCPKTEQATYDAVVASTAFINKIMAAHPECQPGGNKTSVCQDLYKAVAAHNVLIDAIETYCAGPDFNGGGACNPPAKGTPALTQATAKLQTAMSAYSQAEKDLKGVL